MNIFESLKVAWRGIVANKVRSGLTMLGIIIGVGAVVAMVSIGAGATQSVTGRIEGLGSNLLTITPSSGSQGAGARLASGSIDSLSMGDAKSVKDNITLVKNVSPEYTSRSQVIFKSSNVNTTINGVTPTYESVHNFNAEFGEFISVDDDKTQSRVAVLGQTVVTDLFNGTDPIGKTIKIENIPFRVIGVMESKGGSGFQNPDDAIFIPLSTAQKRVYGATSLGAIAVEVTERDLMSDASDQITSLLLNRHDIADPNEADFRLFNQEEVLATINEVTGTLTLLLGGIAGISLLVGGIGIMNIMLVSVTERTREIGLRKAIGAKRRDILLQFLIEATVLSLFGGMIGIVFGIAGSRLISSLAGWDTIISPNSIILAFLFSAGIGIFFGVFPARRAAHLNPIEALRYE